MLTGAAREGLEKGGLLNWSAARQFAEKIIAQFDVRTPGPGNAARSLSGGNLQKFVIGREVLQRPELLVVNQPTWGVDASAAASIRQALLGSGGEWHGAGGDQPGSGRVDGNLRSVRGIERRAVVAATARA